MASLPSVPGEPRPPALPAGPPELRPCGRERDFLLLTVFVLAEQGYIDRAGVLAEALHLLGDASAETLLARAILRFFAGDWAAALAALEDLDRSAPIERFGAYRLDERQRMRRYVKARCLFELRGAAGARDAIEVYLRHGADGPDPD